MTDTRTPQEIAYDAARLSRAPLDTQPEPEALRTQEKLMRFIDRAPTEERKDMALLGMELIAYSGGTQPIPDHLRSALVGANYELWRQKQIAEAPAAEPEPAEPAIEISYVYRNPERDGDYTTRPGGPVAFTDYTICDSTGVDRVYISFAAGGDAPMVGLGGNPIPLDQAERLFDSFQRLLDDPRVQAARAAWEARQKAL